jgi:O-antigen polymerase
MPGNQQDSLITQRPEALTLWSLGFLFVVGLSYFQPHLGGDGLSVSYNTFSWIPFTCLIGIGCLTSVASSSIRYSQLTLGLGLCVLLMLAPALYPQSQDPFIQGKLYGLIAGLLLFSALQQQATDEKFVFDLLFISLLGILFQSLLAWYLKYLAPAENVWSFDSDAHLPFGNFRQPNVMGSLLATGLVLAMFLLSHIQDTDSFSRFRRIACLLTPLITVPLILLLNSRVAWLGALIGAGLVLSYLVRSARRQECIGFLLQSVLGILVGVILVSSGGEGWSSAVAKLEVDQIRSVFYPQVMSLILANPFSGVGIGNFEAAFNLYAASLYAAGEPMSGVTNLHHPHNEVLYWAAEGGAIALLGMLLAAWLVFASILRVQKPLRLPLIGLFFPIVLHTQTEYPFYHSIAHWLLFVLFIFVVDALAKKQRVRRLKSTILIGTAGALIPVTTALFMATTLHAASVLRKYETVPGTSPEILYSIVNPMVWRERILWRVRTNLMLGSLASGDTSQVQPFIELVEARIQTMPRKENFQDLIFAYDVLGESEKAELVFLDAQYRFPSQEFRRLEGGMVKFQTYSELPEEE